MLEQLAPLYSAREYLPCDIINILELLGKADNIPFNQLYKLTENCMDKYYTNVIKALTQLLKQSFADKQTMLVNLSHMAIDKQSSGRCSPSTTISLTTSMTSKHL